MASWVRFALLISWTVAASVGGIIYYRVGVEHLAATGTNTKVRKLKGVIPTDYEITYSQGDVVRYTLTCLVADEEDGSEPATKTTPTGGGDAAFHNVTVDVDGATVSKLQEATLSFSSLYRYQRDANPTPVAAVLATSRERDGRLGRLPCSLGDPREATTAARLVCRVALRVGGTVIAVCEACALRPELAHGPPRALLGGPGVARLNGGAVFGVHHRLGAGIITRPATAATASRTTTPAACLWRPGVSVIAPARQPELVADDLRGPPRLLCRLGQSRRHEPPPASRFSPGRPLGLRPAMSGSLPSILILLPPLQLVCRRVKPVAVAGVSATRAHVVKAEPTAPEGHLVEGPHAGRAH